MRRSAPTHEWTARRVHPASAALYAEWRARIGLASPQPTTIVATAGGGLDPSHPGLSVQGTAFTIAGAPWADLVSVRRADDHLFLRYRIVP